MGKPTGKPIRNGTTQNIPLHVVRNGRSWPKPFDGIPNPPAEIWLRGNLQALETPRRIAIVGSRSASGYGLDQACLFAASLANAGFVIVSGLARGIDQAAHLGALDAGGQTIAILGNGVDNPWPHFEHLPRLLEQGLLLSEHSPGQGPRRHHFPLRNRLIAALSDAVLVVEAAHASGSLITAHWALEIGREVFAIPGRVDHAMASGTLRLLREGARAVGTPAQLLDDLGYDLGLKSAGGISDENTWHPNDPDQAKLFQCLQGESLTVDELAARIALPLPSLLAHLSQLQLAGIVVRGPGGLYRSTPNGGSG